MNPYRTVLNALFVSDDAGRAGGNQFATVFSILRMGELLLDASGFPPLAPGANPGREVLAHLERQGIDHVSMDRIRSVLNDLIVRHERTN